METTEKQCINDLRNKYSQYIEFAELVSKTRHNFMFIVDLEHHKFLHYSKCSMQETLVENDKVYEKGFSYLSDFITETDLQLLKTAFSQMPKHYELLPSDLKKDYSIFVIIPAKVTKKPCKVFCKLSFLSFSDSYIPQLAFGEARLVKDTYPTQIMAGVLGSKYFYNYTSGEGSGYDAVSFVELSADERKMLSLSMQGRSLNEIADIMAKSTNTIKFYRRQIFYKFGVNNISEAIAYALENTVMQDDKIIYVKINSIDKSKQNKRFSIGFASCWAVFVAFIVSIFKDDTD